MPSVVILTSVTHNYNGVSGDTHVEFSDGSGLTLPLADLRDDCLGLDENLELAKKICLARAFASSSDLSNISIVQDKALTFDLSQADPIKIGPVQGQTTGVTSLRG